LVRRVGAEQRGRGRCRQVGQGPAEAVQPPYAEGVAFLQSGGGVVGTSAITSASVLVGSSIQLSWVLRGVQLEGDRRWSPVAYRLQVPPA